MSGCTPRFGAHVSVAGGISRSVARAVNTGCDAFQIFTRNANQWRPAVLPRAEIDAFRRALDASGLGPVVSHASYLINLASTDPALRAASRAALADEIDRAEALGLLGVVLHPGARGAASEAAALDRIAAGLRAILRPRRRGATRVLLEGTAGQGTAIGHHFEHLAGLLERLDGDPRVGVCLDTCHLLAAGYDLATASGYRSTFAAFGRLVGFDRLDVVHVNDSKRPCGSRVDRHAHIGEGFVGLDGFRRLVNDARLARVPMVLETEKGPMRGPADVEADPMDLENLRRLRGLVRSAPRRQR